MRLVERGYVDLVVSTSANATEIFQEGLLLPPIKIVEGGVAQTDIERIILANSRQPALVPARRAAPVFAVGRPQYRGFRDGVDERVGLMSE